MDVSLENKKLRLNIFNASQKPPTYDCNEIDVLEEIIEETTPTMLMQDLLQAY